MEFEQLLRKYLSGTISDAELEHFQELLDRVPEYEAELRQTLEVRSLLHDDALTLTPPSDLSDHIRIAVGSSFAADAIAEREEKVRQRRMLLYPFRLSATILATACVVAGIALSPTLPKSSAPQRSATVTRVESAPTNAPAPVASSRNISSDDRPAASTSAPTGRADRTEPSTILATVPAETVENLWMVGHEVPHRIIYTTPATEAESPASVAQASENQEKSFQQHFAQSSILSRDPAQLLNKGILLPIYNPAIDSSTHRPVSEEALTDATMNESIVMAGADSRKLTIGVTLGSGQVTETQKPTALLQNSYYLSFSVSGSDRIGVEMGASAFQQENRSSDGFNGKRSQGEDPNHDLLFGMIIPTGGNGGAEESMHGNTSSFLTKKTLGSPEAEQKTTVQTPPRNTLLQDTVITSERFEKQITYGAVFYDRRVNLNRSWDVCGRVMVGGANNALMGNVRAYAGFTPGRKNITLTMGVGGAALYNFTSKGPKVSANYGVYYGIETGF